jgi:hypothetical protein
LASKISRGPIPNSTAKLVSNAIYIKPQKEKGPEVYRPNLVNPTMQRSNAMSVSQDPIPSEIQSSNLVQNNGEKPSDPFAAENLRLDQSYLLGAGTKTHLLHVAVRRPRKQEFIRVHPSDEYHTTQV